MGAPDRLLPEGERERIRAYFLCTNEKKNKRFLNRDVEHEQLKNAVKEAETKLEMLREK